MNSDLVRLSARLTLKQNGESRSDRIRVRIRWDPYHLKRSRYYKFINNKYNDLFLIDCNCKCKCKLQECIRITQDLLPWKPLEILWPVRHPLLTSPSPPSPSWHPSPCPSEQNRLRLPSLELEPLRIYVLS